MSNFSDKFAETIEIPLRSTNIQLSQAKVNQVATEGKGALTFTEKKKEGRIVRGQKYYRIAIAYHGNCLYSRQVCQS